MRLENIKLKRFSIFYVACVCYDDTCYLEKFAINPIRSQLTDVAKYLSDTEYAVDKFHFKSHINKFYTIELRPV